MKEVTLEEVLEDELELLHKMQVRAFMPLYEKYHDDISPAVESLEYVKGRFSIPSRKYYFVMNYGIKVGAINIGTKNADDIMNIGPFFILPEFQNMGFGYAAIQEAFKLYPEALHWHLDTILQEPTNCHLYEKCGFVRTGSETVINDKMTIVDYELLRGN
ncbi:MAG: GNAT family N-acetyltransferase [Clostridia bacterium]|nr:GNAT family N-acetyltransferase [Clostridia bacterium]